MKKQWHLHFSSKLNLGGKNSFLIFGRGEITIKIQDNKIDEFIRRRITKTKKFLKCAVTVLFLIVFAAGCSGTKSQSEKNAARDSVRAMTDQTLAQLYQNETGAKGAVADAAGYAVFSDFGFKVMFLGGAQGKGTAVNNATKQETFMKMLEFQPGLGVGAEKYRLVFINDQGVQREVQNEVRSNFFCSR